MELKGIKNIIFDLGAVIININPNNAIQGFQTLFADSFGELERALEKKKILTQYEIGEITTPEFIAFFQQFNPSFTNEEITHIWNSMLLNIPIERIQLIKELSKQYRVFLLSNTNDIHLNYINKYVSGHFQLSSMGSIFEQAYYSHEMKLRKPNLQIFQAILDEHHLIPQETLFIDDTKEHINSAKQLGLATYHLVNPTTIIDIF